MADAPSYAELTPDEAAAAGMPAPVAPAPAPPTVEAPPATLVVEKAGQQYTIDARKATRFLGSGFELAPTQYQAGGYGVPVEVDGQLKFLPSEEASREIRALRAQPATAGMADAAEQRREHETLGAQIRTGVSSAYSGLTGGLSDVALDAADQGLTALGAPGQTGYAEQTRLDRQANPGIDTAGQVIGLGLGAGVLAGGGALRALAAPVRAVGALGEGAGAIARGAAAALGATEGGVAARAVGAVARGAVEFGGLEAGQEASRQALAQQGYDADRLLVAAGHGAAMGAVLGGAGSLALSGARGAVGYGVERAGQAVTAGREALGEVGSRAVEYGKGLVERGKEVAEQGYERLKTSGTLDRFGSEQALKSTGGTAGQFEKLSEAVARSPELKEAIERKILDEVPAITGVRVSSRAQMAEAAEKLVARDGEQVGQLVRKLSDTGVRTDISAWVGEQRRAVADKLGSTINPDLERGAKQIEGWFSDIEKKAGGDPLKLWETKRTIGKQVDWKAGADNAYNELKKDLYFGLDREITRIGTESAEQMGEGFAATWRKANSEYQASRWVRDATAKGAKSEAKNRSFGLSEQFGLVAGAMMGGPMAIPGALAGAAAQHLGRKYGSQVISQALLRPDGLRAVAAQVDAAIGQTARAFLAKAAPTAQKALEKATAAGSRLSEVATTTGQRLSDVGAEVATTTGRAARVGLAEGSSRLSQDAPRPRAEEYRAATQQLVAYQAQRSAQTSGQAPPPSVPPALVEATDRGAAFLASKMPNRAPVQTVAGMETPAPSPAEQARFLRYDRAVNDPLGFVTGNQGPLSREGVEAIRAAHPAVYQQLVEGLQGAVADREAAGEPLSRSERRALAEVMGLPADASRGPATVAAVQAALAAGAQAALEARPPPPGLRRPLSLPSSATRSEQITGDILWEARSKNSRRPSASRSAATSTRTRPVPRPPSSTWR